VLVDTTQRRDDFAEIPKVDANRRADRILWHRLVDVEHLIAVRHQIPKHRPAQFAAAARHDNFGHVLPPLRQ
jgi:hypothetical protein